MQNDRIDEPDVTPLINVNLLVLVMSLLISSHAAKLLPLELPKVAETGTQVKETVHLSVGAGRYTLGEKADLGPEALPAAVAEVPDGSVVVVEGRPDALPTDVALAVDCVMANDTLQVILDTKDAVHLQVSPTGYRLSGIDRPLSKDELAEEVRRLEGDLIVLVSMDPKAKYERLVYAMDRMMAHPGLKVAFGQPPAPAAATAATAPAAASATE